VISDHADWPALLRTVADSGASRVLVTHGYVEPFVRALCEAGVDAAALRTGWRGEPEAEGGT
jgi:putative mRNA 3-end processing factor